MYGSLSDVGGNAFIQCLGMVSRDVFFPIIKWLLEQLVLLWKKNQKNVEYKFHSGAYNAKDFEKMANKYGWKTAENDFPFRVKGFNKKGKPILQGNYTIDEKGVYRDFHGNIISKEKAGELDILEQKRYNKFERLAKINDFPFAIIPSTDGKGSCRIVYPEDRKMTLLSILNQFRGIENGFLKADGTPASTEELDALTNGKASERLEEKQVSVVKEKMGNILDELKSIAIFKNDEWNELFWNTLSEELLKEFDEEQIKEIGEKLIKESKEGSLDKQKVAQIIADAKKVPTESLDADKIKEVVKILANKPDAFVKAFSESFPELMGADKASFESLTTNSTYADVKKIVENVVADGEIVELLADENAHFSVFNNKDNKLCIVPNKQFENTIVMDDSAFLAWTSYIGEQLGMGSANEIYSELASLVGRDGFVDFVGTKTKLAEKMLPLLGTQNLEALGTLGQALVVAKTAQNKDMDISIFKECRSFYDVKKVASARDMGVDIHMLQENGIPVQLYPSIENMYRTVTGISMEGGAGTSLEQISAGSKDLLSFCMSKECDYTSYEIDALTGWMEDKLEDFSVEDISLESAGKFIEDRRETLKEYLDVELGRNHKKTKVEEVDNSQLQSLNVRLAESSLSVYDDICEGEMRNVFETLDSHISEAKSGMISEGIDVEKFSPSKRVFDTLASDPNQDLFIIDGEKTVFIEQSHVVENLRKDSALKDAPMFTEAFYSMKEDGTVYCHIELKDSLQNHLKDENGKLFDSILQKAGAPYADVISPQGESISLYNIDNIVQGKMNKNPNDVILTDDSGKLYVIRKLDKTQLNANKSHSRGQAMTDKSRTGKGLADKKSESKKFSIGKTTSDTRKGR